VPHAAVHQHLDRMAVGGQGVGDVRQNFDRGRRGIELALASGFLVAAAENSLLGGIAAGV